MSYQPTGEMTPPPAPPRRRHRARNALLIVGGALLVLFGLSALFSTLPSGPSRDAAVSHSAPPATVPQNQPTTEIPSPPPSPAPDVMTGLPQGVSVDITQDGTDAAHVKVARVVATTQPGDPEFGSRPRHGVFLIVRVSARTLNNYDGGFDINPLDFYAKVAGEHFDEGDGNAFDALTLDQGEMDASTLGPGERTSGLLVFDVPRSHGTIVYAPNYDGQPLASWRF